MYRSHLRRNGAVLAVASGLLLTTAMPAGAHGGDTTRVHACVTQSSGTVRIVGANDACRSGETPLDWTKDASAATYTAGSGLALTGNQFSVTGAPWGGLTGVPSGFADGTDNDTTTALDVTCASACISAAELADDAVDLAAMQNNSVGTGEIIDESVVSADLATGSVTTQKIFDGTVDTDDIKDGAITTRKLKANYALGQTGQVQQSVAGTEMQVAVAPLTTGMGNHPVLVLGQVQATCGSCDPATGALRYRLAADGVPITPTYRAVALQNVPVVLSLSHIFAGFQYGTTYFELWVEPASAAITLSNAQVTAVGLGT